MYIQHTKSKVNYYTLLHLAQSNNVLLSAIMVFIFDLKDLLTHFIGTWVSDIIVVLPHISNSLAGLCLDKMFCDKPD